MAEGRRYAKQIPFAHLGESGQQRLGSSRIGILGVGALGTHLANGAVRSGIGFVRLWDRDVVELSNLPRQILFREADIGAPKAPAAAVLLREIHSGISITGEQREFTRDTAGQFLDGLDLVLDATDNFPVRQALNAACWTHHRPWIHAGVTGSTGQTFPVLPPSGPCYRCLVPGDPHAGDPTWFPTITTQGIIEPTVAAVSARALALGFRVLLGMPPEPEVWSIDIWTGATRTFSVGRDPGCPVCGPHHQEES